MKLEKVFDHSVCQIYTIQDASKVFKTKYPSKFIVVHNSSAGIVVNLLDSLTMDDIMLIDGCM